MQIVNRALRPIAKVCVYAALSFLAYCAIGITVLILTGCSSKQPVRYVKEPIPYAVPVECNLTLPPKNLPTGDVMQDVANVATDADIARAVAKGCGAKDE